LALKIPFSADFPLKNAKKRRRKRQNLVSTDGISLGIDFPALKNVIFLPKIAKKSPKMDENSPKMDEKSPKIDEKMTENEEKMPKTDGFNSENVSKTPKMGEKTPKIDEKTAENAKKARETEKEAMKRRAGRIGRLNGA
jgi:molecular chaperone DnaK (HSP70)